MSVENTHIGARGIAEAMKGVRKIFFIGIGGISMSALAHILKNDGFSVSGSDFKESDTTKELAASGISVAIGHRAENVEGAGLVVYTAAIKEDNPELKRARELGIPAIERAVLLGEMMKKSFLWLLVLDSSLMEPIMTLL